MWAKQLKIVLLLIAGFVGVASTVIPHHHHDNGAVCFSLFDTNHQDQHDEGDNNEAPFCDDNCMNRMNTTRTSMVDVVDLLRVIPIQISVGSWALALLSPFVDETPLPEYGVYIERLHSVAYLHTLFLRAPPVA